MIRHSFTIAAIQSGTGKTTISLGLMSALCRSGHTVAPFKVGPDFIDPGLHRVVTGRTSWNLDIWMCGDSYVGGLFEDKSSDCDVAIVEGVMGLFDGEHSSTAEVARLLSVPVVVVLDVRGMAQSAAALIAGIRCIDPDLSIAGVILNRISSERHYRLVSEAITRYCDTKVFGCLPHEPDIGLSQRHLGLLTAEDGCLNSGIVERLTSLIQDNIDLDGLLDATLIQSTGSRPLPSITTLSGVGTSNAVSFPRVAVAKDNAFCFYYEDNLEMFQRYGVRLLFFSPLQDEGLPDGIDGLYLGGGYPELYAGVLSANISMLNSVRRFITAGGVTYAECGGFMYLSEGITGLDGVFNPMASVFPAGAIMKNRRVSLGYRQATLLEDTIIGKKGDVVKGHEFHYSEMADMPTVGGELNQHVKRVFKTPQGAQGFMVANCLASYIHLHFGSNLNIVRCLVDSMTP
ncbi:MAG: cobyrinate a,c-diamide synthase [Nitrospirae bacterium]|nr:cobyrinate a,c-diamide synthase [Nitrospirota bacterium]